MRRRDLLQSGLLIGVALFAERASSKTPPIPVSNVKTAWTALDFWIAPSTKFSHYNQPIIDDARWRLTLAGPVPSTSRFISRDYIMEETSVGRMVINAVPGRVGPTDAYRIEGMAWGLHPILMVEVKIDDELWQQAALNDSKAPFTWQSWTLDWTPTSGEHRIITRAIDTSGAVQSAPDDPLIAICA